MAGTAGADTIRPCNSIKPLAFELIRAEGCTSSGSAGGDHVHARLHYSEMFGNQEDF